MDKIPTQDEYENALKGDEDLNKMIITFVHEELILSVSTSSFVGKVAFRLVKNMKSEDFWRETARWHGTGW